MIADSSFLIALFYPDDALHQRSLGDFSSTEGVLIVPDRVLEETFTTLCYKVSLARARSAIADIRQNRRFSILAINEIDIQSAWAMVESVDKKFSFVDCVILALCSQMGQRPLSYDDALLKAAQKASAYRPLDNL